MPITFDTLEELERFCGRYLNGRAGRAKSVSTETEPTPAKPGRRGRRPAAVVTPGTRGRKRATTRLAEVSGGAADEDEDEESLWAPTRRRTPRQPGEETLTSKIQSVIQKFVDAKREFTANDVYEELAKADADVKKQSVITSVLKQMNSKFSDINVEERPGRGPRNVKVYLP